MSDRFGWMGDALRLADQQGNRRRLVPRSHNGVFLDQPGRRLVNFGSNDYLGIAMDRLVSVEQLPGGATSSPLVCGFTPLHARLCDELASFEKTEAAVLFPSGFAACCAVMATLPDAGDLILSDALNHASLIDGCRLSKAERFIYPHRDIRAVLALLQSHRHRFRRAFLVTDTVFSMDGTLAPLEALAEIAERFDVIPIVDEAHATGVLGEHGGGLCDEVGCADRVPIRIGTLSKAIGAQGGFVAGPRVVVDYLIQHARPLIYSTAAPQSIIAAALEGLRIIREHPERRAHVRQLTAALSESLRGAGMRLTADQTPILPVVLNDARRTVQISAQLAERGFFVPSIRPPTVPTGTSRLRISLSAAHSHAQVIDLASALVDSVRERSLG